MSLRANKGGAAAISPDDIDILVDDDDEPSSSPASTSSAEAATTASSQNTSTAPDGCFEIVRINGDDSTFTLNEENLQTILDRCAAVSDKVVIVSVVGAFRTGKSFLLDLFLRYLRYTEEHGDVDVADDGDVPAWVTAGGSHLTEGQLKVNSAGGSGGSGGGGGGGGGGGDVDDSSDDETASGGGKAASSSSNSDAAKAAAPGFLWRGGKERMTTGIWMFARPFARKLADGSTAAVLLMDTQGMFDFQTSKELTAAIFGLSTLISSYQIYNLSKQIQVRLCSLFFSFSPLAFSFLFSSLFLSRSLVHCSLSLFSCHSPLIGGQVAAAALLHRVQSRRVARVRNCEETGSGRARRRRRHC
jgi:hypothetical protein